MLKLASLMMCTLLLAACQQSSNPMSPAASGDNGASAGTAVAEAASAPIDQPGEPLPPVTTDQLYAEQMDGVLKGDWRGAGDKARDKYRHPNETLSFFEVQPDMTVIEITPGSGWYSKVLAPWLADDGHYVAAVVKSEKPKSEAAQNETALQKLFKAHPEQFGKAEVVDFDRKAPVFGPADSADRVLTFRNVHNWATGGTAPAMFKAFFQVLKPGGVLGVVDHRADKGAQLDKVKDSGYLPLAYVIKLATDAGFTLDAESEINANADDTHDHPKGVWTLPPTLTLGDQDKAKYEAIGESDRMTLRFIKPKPDQIKQSSMEKGPAQPM